MKKKSFLISCLLLIVTLAMALCACGGSTYGKIKSAYEAKNYEEVESVTEHQSKIDEALGEEYESACTAHLLRNGLNAALILEFNSTKKMEEAFEDSATLRGFLKDLNDKGVTEAIAECELVNGNCVLLFYTPLSDAKDIFKNA